MSLRALLRRLGSSSSPLQLQPFEIDWQDLENVHQSSYIYCSQTLVSRFLRVYLHDLGVSVLRRLLTWWRFRFAWHFRRAMNQARAGTYWAQPLQLKVPLRGTLSPPLSPPLRSDPLRYPLKVPLKVPFKVF